MKKARPRSQRRKISSTLDSHVLSIDETMKHFENIDTLARLLRALSGAPEFLETDLVARAGEMILDEVQTLRAHHHCRNF